VLNASNSFIVQYRGIADMPESRHAASLAGHDDLLHYFIRDQIGRKPDCHHTKREGDEPSFDYVCH
jgi:hypothetical protein